MRVRRPSDARGAFDFAFASSSRLHNYDHPTARRRHVDEGRHAPRRRTGGHKHHICIACREHVCDVRGGRRLAVHRVDTRLGCCDGELWVCNLGRDGGNGDLPILAIDDGDDLVLALIDGASAKDKRRYIARRRRRGRGAIMGSRFRKSARS
jgi:hypothetical protein